MKILQLEILKTETWDLKVEILEFWNFVIWNFKHEIWGLKFVQLEILETEGLNLKIGNWESGNFKIGNGNYELKI